METDVMHLGTHVRVDWTNGCVDGKMTNENGDGAPGLQRHDNTSRRRTATCAEKTWKESIVGLEFESTMLRRKPMVENGVCDACRNPPGEKFGEWTQDEDVHEACSASDKDGMSSCRSRKNFETASMVVGAPETSATGAWGRSGALVQHAVGNYAQLFIAFVCLMLHLLAG